MEAMKRLPLGEMTCNVLAIRPRPGLSLARRSDDVSLTSFRYPVTVNQWPIEL